MPVEDIDVVVVGAGPFALSVTAHLRARGVECRAFGPAMQFWLDMPAGINLKSYAFATNIYVPHRGHDYPAWCRANGLEDFEPCTMESFARYGLWVKDELLTDVDATLVKHVSRTASGRFEVRLTDERRLDARRVVCATGLSYLAQVPAVLSGLPRGLLSHTSEHRSYAAFRGKDVAIVGGGASAVEAGVLVHEAGGRPQVLVRAELAHFGTRLQKQRSILQRIRRPNSVLGVGMRSRLMQALPFAVRLLPDQRRVRFAKNAFGPSVPWWITTRVWGRVPIFVQTEVQSAEAVGSRARLRVYEEGQGERVLEVDHVIAGTGYVNDVDRLDYLDPKLRHDVRRIEAAPRLSRNFESSVPGAYFVGPLAANSFGPLFRFVAGARYAAPAIARHLAGPVRSVSTALRRRVPGGKSTA